MNTVILPEVLELGDVYREDQSHGCTESNLLLPYFDRHPDIERALRALRFASRSPPASLEFQCG